MSGDPIAAVLPDIAARLRARAEKVGGDKLRERKDLELCTVAALTAADPERVVEKDRKLAIPCWSPVDRVDALIRPSALDGAASGWELRAVRVEPVGEKMTPFRGGWPFPRPVDAVRPLRSQDEAAVAGDARGPVSSSAPISSATVSRPSARSGRSTP